MAIMASLLMIACYGLALYFWWDQQKPIFALALVSGHVGSLASPLWPMLYDFSYNTELDVVLNIFGEPLPTLLFIGSAWFYTLPALGVLYLYYRRWWYPGYLAGLITYGVSLVYYTIWESIGLRMDVWDYPSDSLLPLGISDALVSTLMSALISLSLLYVLLMIRRFSLISMAFVLVPASLFTSLFIRGLLGAPLWITRSIGDAQNWVVVLGVVSTLALLVWAIHIVIWGVSQIESEP